MDADQHDAAAGSTPEAANDAAATNDAPRELSRRDALRTLAALTAAVPLGEALTAGEAEAQARPAGAAGGVAQPPARAALPQAGPRGTRWDPDLLRPKKDWPRLLTASELAMLTALVDMIIPADDKSPSASAVGVPAYINEYVSYPAEAQQRDLVRIRGGLAWLNTESRKRFDAPFTRLTQAQKTAICDDICWINTAKPEFRMAARFFDQVRDLAAVGFYTTDAGMKDIGYVGNVALPKFDGPPPEVLRKLGLDDA